MFLVHFLEEYLNNILPKFLQLLWDKQNNCIIWLASFLLDIGNYSADPDQTPQNAASDQGLHCLLA